MDLEGKVAFVTGAAGGIGRASALALAGAGARLAIADRNAAALDETAALVTAAGGAVIALPVDLTDADAVEAAVGRAADHFGGLDCAHNNAGLSLPPHGFLEHSQEDFRLTFDINLFGIINCMRPQIRLMLAGGGGAIVNTASALGLVAAPGNSAYVASKHAVIGLSKAAAVEYAAQGIRINAVCPGFISTAMTADQERDPAVMAAIRAAHPIGRAGTAGEVADAVLWLLSARSSFLVGSTIAIDGGLTAQ